MQPLIEALTLAFTAQRPNVQIVIQGSDSQAGLEAVRQGQADAGLVAQPVAASELDDLELHTLVEKDAIAIIIHPLIRLDSLTTTQVRDIFSGTITNWVEVGGPEAPIRPVVQADGSDTRATFEQIIMGQPGLISGSAIVESSDQIVRNFVANHPYSIGFITLENAGISANIFPNNPHWAVVDTGLLDVQLVALDGIAPNLENIRSNLYPLTQPLNLITQNQPNPLVQEWLEFIMSPEGQQIIADTGRLPVAR
jgi:phosphate transport system substrate-binding protein